MKKILIILSLVVLIACAVFVLRKKPTSENPLRSYAQGHEPYQDFSEVSYAVYITPEEIIITYDKKNEIYWQSSVSDFKKVLLPTLCGGECKDSSVAIASIKIYSIGIDVDKKVLQITFVDKASLESTHPTFFEVEGSFDGKNIIIQ